MAAQGLHAAGRCHPETAQAADLSPHAEAELPDIARAFPEQYEAQLQQKVERVQALFSSWTLPELQVFRSPAEHYRMRCVPTASLWIAPAPMTTMELSCRAEFGVWHDKGQVYYIMHEQVCMQLVSAAPGQRHVLSDEASAQPASQPASSQAATEALPLEAPTPAAVTAAGHDTPASGAPAEVADPAAATAAAGDNTPVSDAPAEGAAPAGKQGKAAGQKRPRDSAASRRRRVDQFPRASRLMNELMAAVMRHANSDPVLSHKLFQVRCRHANSMLAQQLLSHKPC